MNTQLLFWAVFLILAAAVIYCDLKFSMLRDMSAAERKPHSFARVQLAWWSVIILSSFVAVMFEKGVPTFETSTLILLGISAATGAAARMIDVSDKSNEKIKMIQDENGENFLLDILSDENGVSIYRFQTLVFNLGFGVWFMLSVVRNLATQGIDASAVMPPMSENNLILLGLSSATYAALKATENKPSAAQTESVRDEAIDAGAKAQG